MRTTERLRPPSNARASGAYDSLPAPSFRAIGNRPMMVASEVISTGRNRTRQATATASRTAIPSLRRCRVNSTMRMLLETAMPTSMMTPISDITFSVVSLSQSVRITPVIPGGTAIRMMNGSTKDWNWATSTRYSSTTARQSPRAKLLNETRMPCTIPRNVTVKPSGTFVCAMISSMDVAILPRSSLSGRT